MTPKDVDQCSIHEEMLANMQSSITNTQADVTEIKDLLVGTMQKSGYIRETDNRINSLEMFKKITLAVYVWGLRGVVGGGLITVITVAIRDSLR